MASAGEIIYPMLESLAVVQPLVALGPAASTAAPSACSPLADARGSAASGRDILAALSSAPASFNIVVTFRPRAGLFPPACGAHLTWSSGTRYKV